MAYSAIGGYGLRRTLASSGTVSVRYAKTDTGYISQPEGLNPTQRIRFCRSSVEVEQGIGFKVEPLRLVTGNAFIGYTYSYVARVTFFDGSTHDFLYDQYVSPTPGTGASVDVDPRAVDFTASLSWEMECDSALYYGYEVPGTLVSLENGYLGIQWLGAPDAGAQWSITIICGDTLLSGSSTVTVTGPASAAAGSGFVGSMSDRIKVTATSQSVGSGAAQSYACSASGTWAYSNAALSTTASYSWTKASATQSVVYGTQTTTANSDCASSVSGGSGSVVAISQVESARPIKLIGDVFGFEGRVVGSGTPLDPTVTVSGSPGVPTLTATGGSFTHTFTARWELVQGYTGAGPSPFANYLNSTSGSGTAWQLSARTTNAWMTSARGYASSEGGVDRSYGSDLHLKDARLSGAFRLSLAESNTLPNSGDATNPSTDSSVTGGTRRTWGSKLGLTTYRYLSVSVSSPLTTNGTIKIVRDTGGGVYNPLVGGSRQYEWQADYLGQAITGAGPFIIDLLNPTNRPGDVEVDATPATWPEDGFTVNATSRFVRRGEGWLTGPSWLDRLEVIGSAAGSAPTIGALTLLRRPETDKRKVLLTALDQLAGENAAGLPLGGLGDSPAPVFMRPFLCATVDGRVEALSETDYIWNKASGALIPRLEYSVKEIRDQCNHLRNRGVSTSSLLPVAAATNPEWYSDNLPAVGIMGAGYLWNAATQSWSCTIDTVISGGGLEMPLEIGEEISVVSPATIDLDYQLGVSTLSFPGNLGDAIFGHAGDGATIGETTIVGYSVLHSQAYGAVIGDSGIPDPTPIGARVNNAIPGAIPFPDERGAGSSDADTGYYKTGTDWMRGWKMFHDIYSPDASVRIQVGPRRRFPVRFVGGDGKGLASLASPLGWYALAAVETASGTTGIRFRRCDHGVPDVPSGMRWPTLVWATTNPADTWPCLALDPWGKLWLLYERAGVIYQRSSDDEGETWGTESMAFTAGKFPDQDSDPMTGTLLQAAVVAASSGGGYVIKGRVQHSGDASPSAEFTFQWHNGTTLTDMKVKKSAFRLECGHEIQGRWNLALTYEGETEVSYWWCADGEGRTWTRIT